jgi:hypothetical protein
MLVNKQDGTKPRQFYANSLRKVAEDETDYKKYDYAGSSPVIRYGTNKE